MSHWVKSLILLLSVSLQVLPRAFAAEVVFIEVHQNGHPLVLEPGGRFFHVAIRYNGKWLQAHPRGGVTLVKDIRPYGDKFVVLRNTEIADPNPLPVFLWLGKPFDYTYAWDNPEATYCSRLVAELLGVPPQPMSFAAEIWKNHFHKPEGEPGLSPDKLYKELLKRGFKVSPCEGDLI